jgi:hypothetical protein
MVQMRPNAFPSDTVKGEKQVFRKLESLEGADNWIAMHSLDIFGDIPTGQGEADFVVLIPGKGILVVEVKTHSSVDCVDGNWYLNGKLKEKPPHTQASNAMHAIRKDLKEAGIDLYKMPFGFCVWFTGASKTKLPVSGEYKQWMFLFAEDLNGDVRGHLMHIMDKWAEHRGIAKGDEQSGVAVKSSIDICAKALRPDVKLRKSAELRISELNQSLAAALEQQSELMHLISGKKMVSIIPGIAGTGKTHIAIAEAKKAHQRGDRTLFLCYNSILGDYLKSELSGYSLVEVHTISSYMLQLCGLTFIDAKGDTWWRQELPKLAQTAIFESDGLDRFDSLIVDESQDICSDEYLDVLDLSLNKGFSGSAVMFFGDFTHQAIYMSGELALQNLKTKIPTAIDFELLNINCRNTKQIGDTVMKLMGEPGAYSSYRRKEDGIQPTLIPIKPGESTLKHMKEQLSRLEKNFALENVVVLSSNKDKLHELLVQTGVELTDLGFPRPGKLRWGTSQAFKGMEAPAIILVEFEDGNAASKETFYVAGTRAIADLVCIMPQNVIKSLFS